MKLIYHDVKHARLASPFDDALLKVSHQANPLRLASPYIGLGFLQRIIERSIEWKLLSDVEAWLQASNRRHRARCWEFISDNLDRIRHVPSLHAKVAIGNGSVFLGSANFTEKGVLGRAELSILVSDASVVAESLHWFDSLWETASPPVIEEGDALVSALDDMQWTAPKSRVRLTSTAARVAAVLSDSDRPDGFDVAATIARAGIAESVRLQSLEDAYRQLSDAWFSEGRAFSFHELLTAISLLSEKPQARDVWMLLIHETTNHWLGGIMVDGFDRYCYKEGMFMKWEPSALYTISHIDEYLHFIITSIDANPNDSYLPIEDKWLSKGIPAHHILLIVDLLIQSGLLIENDIAGDIEHYSLDPDFEWPKRWNKFQKSHIAFVSKVKQKAIIAAGNEDDEEDLFGQPEPSAFLANLRNRREIGPPHSDPGLDSLRRELREEANSLGISEAELRKMREDVLVAAFHLIKPRLATLTLWDLQGILNEFAGRHLPIGLMREFRANKNGAFLRFKKKGRIGPSYLWLASHHLALYPKALQSWKRLFL